MENKNQITPVQGKKHHWIATFFAILFLLLFLWAAVFFVAPGVLVTLKDNLFGGDRDAGIDAQLEKIEGLIQAAPARDYQFREPSSQARARTIDCKKLAAFQDDLPIINPICLNIYRTNYQEINRKIAEGGHDRVVLYGENIIWDAPVVISAADSDLDLGKSIYDSARFNDQITLPALFGLYGFSDASFINILTPGRNFPIPALYYRLGNDEEVQKVCNWKSGQPRVAGCAFGMWSTIVPQQVLGKKMSLPNQKIFRISDEKNPDYLMFDYLWPANCYTEDTLLHETAHLLLYAERENNLSDALVSLRYFNEHQADVIKIMGTNLVCGSGSVANFQSKSGQKMNLFEFNSVYPPAKMGSVWPAAQDTCQLAMLNEWNRFMAGGDFKQQFAAFISSLWNWMKQGKTISSDRGFYDFLLQLIPDKDTKVNLQYHNCQF